MVVGICVEVVGVLMTSQRHITWEESSSEVCVTVQMVIMLLEEVDRSIFVSMNYEVKHW